MALTVANSDALARVLRPLDIDVYDVLMRLPGEVLILDRKLRTVAQLGRETFGPRAGSVHDEANRRALEGEEVTYQWRVPKARHELRLLTSVSPLRSSSARLTGLLIVTRNLSAVAGDALGLGGPATHQARQLLALERGVRQLTEVIESYRQPEATYPLSVREQDVLHLLREGYRPRSIAERLQVSPQTVRNHLKAIFKKTGTHSQEELITMSRGRSIG